MMPSIVNGMELGYQDWRDYLLLNYGINTLDLPDHCNGCNVAFFICHTLDCKERGLIKARHKNLYDGVADLAIKTFTPTHVRGD